VIVRVMGALAATISVYAAYASPASDGGMHQLHRATHESSSDPPYSAIVLDVNSGKLLHSVNADELRHPASLTKIMTLYLLFERLEAGKLRLDTQLAVSEHAAMQAPTKLGLTPDQMLTVEDAIGGLVTKSANDAAVVIAEALAGDEHEFAELMTRKARALGMSRTVYRNASGLPDDEQVTTARDQALLGRVIQERFPGYYRYFAMSSFKYHGQRMLNHNQLLGQVEGLDGIKTGYTKASGFNLVTSVRRDSRHIVSVVLGGASASARDARMRSLIEEYIVVATPQKSAAATAQARKEPAKMRGTVAEPSTKGTHAADARPANQQTEPATYSVASYERPIRPLSSATRPATVKATTVDKPLAGPLADTTGPLADTIVETGRRVSLASVATSVAYWITIPMLPTAVDMTSTQKFASFDSRWGSLPPAAQSSIEALDITFGIESARAEHMKMSPKGRHDDTLANETASAADNQIFAPSWTPFEPVMLGGRIFSSLNARVDDVTRSWHTHFVENWPAGRSSPMQGVPWLAAPFANTPGPLQYAHYSGSTSQALPSQHAP
jgi:D-alanyl-D-alanine carboxypeptidase